MVIAGGDDGDPDGDGVDGGKGDGGEDKVDSDGNGHADDGTRDSVNHDVGNHGGDGIRDDVCTGSGDADDRDTTIFR